MSELEQMLKDAGIDTDALAEEGDDDEDQDDEGDEEDKDDEG